MDKRKYDNNEILDKNNLQEQKSQQAMVPCHWQENFEAQE
jgi:hypothetical protein